MGLVDERNSWIDLWNNGHVPLLIHIHCKEEWMIKWNRIKGSEYERMSRAAEMLCSYNEWKGLDNRSQGCYCSHIGS